MEGKKQQQRQQQFLRSDGSLVEIHEFKRARTSRCRRREKFNGVFFSFLVQRTAFIAQYDCLIADSMAGGGVQNV